MGQYLEADPNIECYLLFLQWLRTSAQKMNKDIKVS